MTSLDNANPTVFKTKEITREVTAEDVHDPIDSLEVFDLLRNVMDPEHPLTLEQLNVITPDHITVDDEASTVMVTFTPTVNHCSMATLIGLCLRVRLQRALPARFKVDIAITEGGHDQEGGVNKQLNDKERVAAALDNSALLAVVNKGLENVDA